MLVSNSGRLRGLGRLAWVGLLAMGIAACAASTAVQSSDPAPGAIADVRVEHDGEATTVTLLGVEDAVFTAFAQQNPERVVVDLASTRADELTDAVSVFDGLVEEVMLSPYSTGAGEDMTRVEVTLSVPADYRVLPGSDGLEIRVTSLEGGMGEMALSDDDVEADPWAMASDAADDGMGEMVDMGTPDVAPLALPATKLMGVEVTEAGGGSIVHLRADGSVGSVETFTLENPDRLVVDLPGLRNEAAEARIDVGSAHAARVRIGQHDDMVRVVIDAGSASAAFEGRRVIPSNAGLVVALGSGEALDVAVDELVDSTGGVALAGEASPETAELADASMDEASDDAWEPMADASDTGDELAAADLEELPADDGMGEELVDSGMPVDDGSGPVTIYGIEYDAQAERDRVVILGERPVDYLLFEPAPDTVVLTIQNAVIDPEVTGRIAPEPGGPLSLITAFEQPETQGSEVRVVMKRADGLKPQVSRRGALVVVDFPRDGSVAAVPPVLGADPVVASTPSAAMPAAVPASAAAPAAAAPGVPLSSPGPAAAEPAAAIDVLVEGGLVDGKQYPGRRISLDFKDIDMADVLRLVAEVSDLNVIAGDEVQGKVTIRLVDVPWDQALDVILLTKGLGFMRVGNVLRIAPADVLKQEEEMRLQERRALEQLEDLVVKLQPVNYATAGDAKGMVQRLLSARGTVDIDKRTNTLIIKDIPSVIDEATALIKAIDTQTPQVLIEAKVVEAGLEFSREFGVVWGFGAQPLTDAFDGSSPARTNVGGDAFKLDTTSSLGNNATFLNPLTAGPTGLFNMAAFLLDEKINLNLQLQMAENNGDGKVISSPRVVTLDNTKATIEQGVSIPFQTFENGDAQLEFVDAVLKLDVTPHVTADKSIIMKIKVSRNAPDDSVFTLTGSPAIAKNQVDTETLVKDGQTLVLGGIYVVDKGKRQSRVPYLHRIPALGALFRSNEVSDSRKELLIFVTPRVVVTPQTAS